MQRSFHFYDFYSQIQSKKMRLYILPYPGHFQMESATQTTHPLGRMRVSQCNLRQLLLKAGKQRRQKHSQLLTVSLASVTAFLHYHLTLKVCLCIQCYQIPRKSLQDMLHLTREHRSSSHDTFLYLSKRKGSLMLTVHS